MKMARSSSVFFFFFLAFSSLFFSSAFCRTPPNTAKTTATLDISVSLQKTQEAISLTPQTEQSLHESHTSPSSLTLQLHSRDSFKHPSTHKDYKTLTLARLARDSARVDSLNSKLALALSGLDRSDLKPLESDGPLEVKSAEGLQGPIISGTSQGSGEYFSRVGFGRPAKQLYMVLDTGSDVTWVQCEPCTDCYQQADPVFEPSASSSYSSLSCESQPCKSLDVSACRNDTCLYQVNFLPPL